MKHVVWLGLLGVVPLFAAQETSALPKGEVIPRVQSMENPAMSYALYLPSNYTRDRAWPVLMLFDPSARATAPMNAFKDAAERYGFLLACSYDTSNYTAWERNRHGVEAMWNDLIQRFVIDGNRMYAGGMSGGARLASRVAMTTGKIQALVACGAGLMMRPEEAPEFSFEVVSTVGTSAYNFLELVGLEEELNKRGVVNQRLVFEGPHAWPTPEVGDEVLGWLTLRAYRKGLTGLADVKVHEQVQRLTAHAKRLEAQGRPWLAHDRYRFIFSGFSDVYDTAPAASRMRALAEDPGYRERLAEQARSVRLEQATRRDYLARMKQGEMLAVEDPQGLKDLMRWWENKIPVLQKQRQENDNPPARWAADRVYALVWSNIYERTVYHLREGAFEQAIYLNRVAELMNPQAIFPHFNLARAYAQRGDMELALTALERCLSNGYSGRQRLEREPLLKPLQNDPRFQALLERM
jgi:hypothetical protein